MAQRADEFDVIVVGGGHAGAEAAWACANLGVRTALVTLDPSKIGVMSCNPAIGGLAKGQIVREIDALGGLMARAADATGIHFKVLNTSKGPAVRGPRAQCDRHAYAREVRRLLGTRPQIEIVPGAAERFIVEPLSDARPRVRGIEVVHDGRARTLSAGAVVLTTGTFMRGLMHTGESRSEGGRIGEAPAVGVSAALRGLGFELGRLKTGTPPRLRRSSIDWDALEPQTGDDPPAPFSDLTDADPRFPALAQIDCRITSTNEAIHAAIRANLHRAPMYSGQIESLGPRYCPSIEDKVVRFAGRSAHHVFLEPESHESDWVYCNGISTSLPRDVQESMVRAMPGCARAEIVQFGYAVEYDMVRPHQIDAGAMSRLADGLFLAGQINGTSGYEEAGAQGLLAGLNAARFASQLAPVTLARDAAYIGVMMDDLVTKTPVEPYRMFTSRAEHRLLLRADNSADRLTPLGREWGLVDDERWRLFERRSAELDALNRCIDTARLDAEPLSARVRRPDYTPDHLRADLARLAPLAPCVCRPSALVTALAERQYEGYIARHRAEARRQQAMEHRRIPEWLDYASIPGLRTEARQTLQRFRPTTLGQAGRLEGVNPADITLVLVALSRGRPGNRPLHAAC
ncbi:MAG TPA: tRNA uridine-5-carboxymethylaminomethyl(34) synthesis enzyme MnmG [Phycisphaerales bacterium]|nr:tRNA uridine-5-carboxymethylaminomethyl(34) synthesis enzyme MnmG [Phycisphaerales bacterium]